jgi:hypothetical protein
VSDGVKVQTFRCGPTVLPALLIEKAVRSPVCVLGFISGISVLFHWSVGCFYARASRFGYHGSVVHFDVRYCDVSACYFCSRLLGYSASFMRSCEF